MISVENNMGVKWKKNKKNMIKTEKPIKDSVAEQKKKRKNNGMSSFMQGPKSICFIYVIGIKLFISVTLSQSSLLRTDINTLKHAHYICWSQLIQNGVLYGMNTKWEHGSN